MADKDMTRNDMQKQKSTINNKNLAMYRESRRRVWH